MLCSFAPRIDGNTRILILGSMPGNESLREQEYYAFKRNIFWRLMGEILRFDYQLPYEQRVQALLSCKVGLWDVLRGCERKGSLDCSIKKPQPNEIEQLLNNYRDVQKICCNGTAAYRYLSRFFPDLNAVVLPSTSPAAASYSYQEKLEIWRQVLMDK